MSDKSPIIRLAESLFRVGEIFKNNLTDKFFIPLVAKDPAGHFIMKKIKAKDLTSGGEWKTHTTEFEETIKELDLNNNTIYNSTASFLESLTITGLTWGSEDDEVISETIPLDYMAQVNFTSGSTPTTISTNSDLSILWSGEDCDEGEFVPVEDKRYSFLICYDGINVRGVVSGIGYVPEIDSSNQVVEEL